MATIEKSYWRCDRCEMEVPMDDQPRRSFHSPQIALRYNELYPTARGRTISWIDMCPDCEASVKVLMDDMIYRAARAKEAVQDG